MRLGVTPIARIAFLEWIGGPPNPTKWQYRRGVWRRGSDGHGYWRRDDDGGRVWTIEWGAWTDIPGSGASTRSFRDTGLQPSTVWDYQVRAVVGTVAGDGSGVEQGRTQEQGRQFLDIYASDVVEGDGQQRWLVLDFTIVIPDGVRVSAYGADPYGVDPMARDHREWAWLAVWGADSIIHGAGGERLGDLTFGPDGAELHRYVPPAQARSGAAALAQIMASIQKYP